MNKKKPKLKSLRSDANISYVGPIKAAWRSHVIPTVRDVLQVVFNGQVALKLPITKSINRVAENVVSVQIPGAKPKSKSEIIRALKKIYGEWQSKNINSKFLC